MINCCVECFKDSHIRNTIEKYGDVGNCDFCSAKGVKIYDISLKPNPISDMIMSLVQTYSVSDMDEAKMLKESLRDDWDIFNGGSEVIQSLVTAICDLNIHNDIFSEKVIIPQQFDVDFLNDYGVVKGYSWNQFSKSIKYSNRFHNEMFNSDVFASFLSIAEKIYCKNELFYRARIADGNNGFTCDKMYSPPKGKRCAGRVNPDGIGVLYLSSNEKTVLNETRVNAYDYVSIGTFQIKQDIRVVNLSGIAKMSPFLYDNIEQFAVNRKVFQEMACEIAKPLRRNDSTLEYLPTQYISEFVKSQGYDGVEFESTLHEEGLNLALFDESKVDCISVKTVEITKIQYETR